MGCRGGTRTTVTLLITLVTYLDPATLVTVRSSGRRSLELLLKPSFLYIMHRLADYKTRVAAYGVAILFSYLFKNHPKKKCFPYTDNNSRDHDLLGFLAGSEGKKSSLL